MGSMLTRLKQSAVIKFLTAQNDTPIQIHHCLLAVHGEETINRSTLNVWVKDTAKAKLDPIARLKFEAFLHQSSSPDLAPLDFHFSLEKREPCRVFVSSQTTKSRQQCNPSLEVGRQSSLLKE